MQFTTDRVAAVSFEGRLAFRLPLPDTIMKLQRREYYRLATPVVHPLKCEIAGPDGKRFELALADISLGGVCLVGQPAGFSFEPGMALEDCRIDLPEIGAIRAGLCVRNSYVVTLKNGVTSHRTGCEFVKLGSQQEAMVQRYIIRLERERRAKSARHPLNPQANRRGAEAQRARRGRLKRRLGIRGPAVAHAAAHRLHSSSPPALRLHFSAGPLRLCASAVQRCAG